jgi:hypothetical protein
LCCVYELCAMCETKHPNAEAGHPFIHNLQSIRKSTLECGFHRVQSVLKYGKQREESSEVKPVCPLLCGSIGRDAAVL